MPEMELDHTYVYFNRGPNPFRAPQDSGLFRLRRDGEARLSFLPASLRDGGFEAS